MPSNSPNFSSDLRLHNLDTARWLAALAVVLVHCAAHPLVRTTDYGTPAWQWANLYDAAARWCVPIFVMISGALLLDPSRQRPFREFYLRRAARLILPLIFWSLFYLGWSRLMHLWQGEPLGLADWLNKLWSGAPYYHLWYLYMIPGLYFFTPFLARSLRGMNPRQQGFATVGILALAMLDSLHSHLTGNTQRGFFMSWFLPYLGYFLAGRLIYNGQWRIPAPAALLTGGIVLTTLGTWGLSDSTTLRLYFYDSFSLGVIPMALGTFQLLLRNTLLPRLPALAGVAFGIYLLHPVYLDILRTSGLYHPESGTYWVIPVVTLLVFVLSAISTWGLRNLQVGRLVT